MEREGAAQTRGVTGHLNIQERWAHTEVRRNFFNLRVIKPWNNLPEDLRKVPTVDNFKNGFDEWRSAI